MKTELVKNWMTHDVITVTPSTPLAIARNLMKKNKIRRLPVLDDDGKLVGVITLWDIHETKPVDIDSLSIWDLHGVMSGLYVSGGMTPDPVSVSPGDTIGHAAFLMNQNKVSGLPVVDENQRVIGIITESDIFRLVIREWGK